MSKKARRSTPRAATSQTPLTPDAIAHKARANLSGGHYREAIADFKQLIKQDPNPDWRVGLADAYAGRARELSAKGMLKEALVMWENRASLGQDIPRDLDHARLLLRLGQTAPVCALLADDASLPAADRDRLRALLAARLLSGDAAIADRLAEDDPVRRHAGAAQAALAACCAGDETGLREALAALPFRSPYRDWAQILKALPSLPDRPREAAELLGRIGADSAFIDLKQAAELALLPESVFLEALRTAGRSKGRFACMLRGWSAGRIALWDKLARLGTEPAPQAMLRALYQHRESLGADWVRRQSLRLLRDDFPVSMKWLAAVGAPPLTPDEYALIDAWHTERGQYAGMISESWQKYAKLLMNACREGRNDPLDRLRIALALRRTERIGGVLHDADMNHDAWQVARQLEASLDWDPDDLDTWLILIDYYRRNQQAKDARRLLDGATAHWPQNRRLLAAAMDVALDAGAFKKAAGLARGILAQDPINTEVRERLVDAYLAHTRKQVAKDRLDLARKTLAEADEWASGGAARERLDLVTELVALIENSATGAPALRERVRRLGDGLAALVALALAGDGLRLSPSKLFKAIDCPKLAARSAEDLLAALARLRTHLDRGVKLSRDLSDYLAKPLKGAPWKSLARSDLEAACETLRRSRLHPVRLAVAQAALKQWRGAPIFAFHAFEAKYPNGQPNLRGKDVFDLEIAMNRARDEGDERTALRIRELLMSASPFGFGPSPFRFAPEDDFDEDDPLDSPIDDDVAVDAIIAMIRTAGLEQAMDLIGMPPHIKRDFRKMARQIGEKNALEKIITLFEQIRDGQFPDAF